MTIPNLNPKKITRRAFLRSSAGTSVALSTPTMLWFMEECRRFFARPKVFDFGQKRPLVTLVKGTTITVHVDATRAFMKIKDAIEKDFGDWMEGNQETLLNSDGEIILRRFTFGPLGSQVVAVIGTDE